MNSAVKKILGVILAVVVIGYAANWRIDAKRRNDPLYTMKMVDNISNEGDLAAHGEYFTPKGYDLYKWMLNQSTTPDSQSPQMKYSAPKINSDGGCDVWMTGPNNSMFIHLVKGERWQFDDVYVKTIDGKNIDLWATYMKEHPYLTTLKVGWVDMLLAFIQGYMIGMAL